MRSEWLSTRAVHMYREAFDRASTLIGAEQTTADELLSVDDELYTCAEMGLEEIVASVRQTVNHEDDDDDNDDSEESAPVPVLKRERH